MSRLDTWEAWIFDVRYDRDWRRIARGTYDKAIIAVTKYVTENREASGAVTPYRYAPRHPLRVE